MKTFFVKDIIGSTSAISPRKGLLLYDFLVNQITSGESFVLSFDGIEDVVTAFANASIGKLYTNYPSEQLDALITCEGLTDIWQVKLDQARLLGIDVLTREAYNESMSTILNS